VEGHSSEKFHFGYEKYCTVSAFHCQRHHHRQGNELKGNSSVKCFSEGSFLFDWMRHSKTLRSFEWPFSWLRIGQQSAFMMPTGVYKRLAPSFWLLNGPILSLLLVCAIDRSIAASLSPKRCADRSFVSEEAFRTFGETDRTQWTKMVAIFRTLWAAMLFDRDRMKCLFDLRHA
jgi:hypothetical protein